MEYLMITRDDFIHVTDKELVRKNTTIDQVINDIRRVLFEVVAKKETDEFYTDFWTPERGFR